MSTETGLLGLRRFNGAMALLHLAQGVLMLALSSDFSLPVTASFLEFDPAANRLVPSPETLVNRRNPSSPVSVLIVNLS